MTTSIILLSISFQFFTISFACSLDFPCRFLYQFFLQSFCPSYKTYCPIWASFHRSLVGPSISTSKSIVWFLLVLQEGLLEGPTGAHNLASSVRLRCITLSEQILGPVCTYTLSSLPSWLLPLLSNPSLCQGSDTLFSQSYLARLKKFFDLMQYEYRN